MKRLIFPGILVIVILFISIISCQKQSAGNDQPPRLKVFLTDAPAGYDGVLVDIKDVQINLTTDSTSGWQSLQNVATGIYNLLDLTNGKDTLLADSEVPAGGTISQVRLILGSDNFVVLNGDSIRLTTPSAQQSGLKLNVHQRLDSGFLYNMVLDFDAGRSIVKTGNNKYILKPVIRANFQITAGRLKGVVTPDSVATSVLAINGTDTSGTTTDSLGRYQIGGLSAGTYSLKFIPSDTLFKTDQRDGINVALGTITVVDTVKLHQ